MKVTKRDIQKATIGELEELLAELENANSSEAAKNRHMVQERLAKLYAS